MKILFLSADLGVPVLGDKGAAVHVRAMVHAFSAQGHRVSLVAPHLVKSPWRVPAAVDCSVIHTPPGPETVEATSALRAFAASIDAPASGAGEVRRVLYNPRAAHDAQASLPARSAGLRVRTRVVVRRRGGGLRGVDRCSALARAQRTDRGGTAAGPGRAVRSRCGPRHRSAGSLRTRRRCWRCPRRWRLMPSRVVRSAACTSCRTASIPTTSVLVRATRILVVGLASDPVPCWASWAGCAHGTASNACHS